MISLIIFLVALILIVFSLIMKNIELNKGRKIFLASLFAWSDRQIFSVIKWSKLTWSYLTWHNTRLLFTWFMANIRSFVTRVKRRFDHKHSPFFVKKDSHLHKSKGAVSFFLKDVSDYKKSLREGLEK